MKVWKVEYLMGKLYPLKSGCVHRLKLDISQTLLIHGRKRTLQKSLKWSISRYNFYKAQNIISEYIKSAWSGIQVRPCGPGSA